MFGKLTRTMIGSTPASPRVSWRGDRHCCPACRPASVLDTASTATIAVPEIEAPRTRPADISPAQERPRRACGARYRRRAAHTRRHCPQLRSTATCWPGPSPSMAASSVPSGRHRRYRPMLPDWPGAESLRRNSERALYREEPDAEHGDRGLRRQPAANLRRRRSCWPAPMSRWQHQGRAQACCRLSGAPKSWTPADETADPRRVRHAHPARRPSLPHGAHALCRARQFGAARRRAGRCPAARRRLGRRYHGRQERARTLLKAVPPAQRSAGYFFAEAKISEASRINSRQAAAVMLKAPTDRAALVDPDAWWIERRVLSRELVDQGDMKTAYAIVAAHAAESPTNAADAEFHAGWYALRGLDDADAGGEAFRRHRRDRRRSDLAVARLLLARPRRRGRRSRQMPRTYYAEGRELTAPPSTASSPRERIGGQTLNVAYPDANRRRPPDFSAPRGGARRSSGSKRPAIRRLPTALYRALAGQLQQPRANWRFSP